MFQGIIEQVGKARVLNNNRIEIIVPRAWKLKAGESVAVNGVCLTLARFAKKVMTFDLGEETLKISNFGSLRNGEPVNLERSLVYGSRISGHLLLGHAETLARLEKRSWMGDSLLLEFSLRKRHWLMMAKGCVGVSGVSLTINRVWKTKEGLGFSVCIIPETQKRTNLKDLSIGEQVNIETDYLAKITQR